MTEIELYPADIDSSFYKKQVTDFLKIHPSMNQKDGLYIFFEKERIKKLFYCDFEEHIILLYQYPLQKKSRWLTPKDYLDERKGIENKELLESTCQQKIIISKDLFSKIESFHLEKLPYMRVLPNSDFYFLTLTQTSTLWGFKRIQNKNQYFFFKDIRNYLANVPLQFQIYVEIFKFFEMPPFDAILQDCK